MKCKAIILAAGKGSRMKSNRLKVLHHVAGKPILEHVVDTVLDCNVDELYIVVGHQKEMVQEQIQHPKIHYVVQEEQLGTGHAVMQVMPHLSEDDSTMFILAGDCPLIELKTLQDLLSIHQESNSSATILSAKMEDPASYGRILRGKMGTVMGIREAKDCTPEELLIDEINTGIYAFQKHALRRALGEITNENKQNEYYVTDTIQILKEKGEVVAAYCTKNPDEAVGINTRMDLASINEIIYSQNNLKHMMNGVTIISPETTFIDSTVKIGLDTIIHPFTTISGHTVIGEHVTVGPHSHLENTEVADNSDLPPFTHKGPKA